MGEVIRSPKSRWSKHTQVGTHKRLLLQHTPGGGIGGQTEATDAASSSEEEVVGRAADRVGLHSVQHKMHVACRVACLSGGGIAALATAACATTHTFPALLPQS